MVYTDQMRANKAVVLTASVFLGFAGVTRLPVFSSAAEVSIDSSLSTSECVIDPATKKWAKFQALLAQWQQERGATSSINQMSMLPAYQKIIGLGEEAVPMIIAQLKAEGDDPDQWFWALAAITGENPVKPEDQGNFARMAQSWIEWAETEEYAG